MTLTAKADEGVDVYALRVSQAYSRLLAEAERTAPLNVSPHEHAFEQALIASFENGLPPDVRLDMIREDASQSFMASKARARKHEANKLRSATTTPVASVSAVAHNGQLQPDNNENRQRIEELEKIVSSLSRGRIAQSTNGGAKRDRSRSRADNSGAQKSRVSFQKGTKQDGASGAKEE